MPTYNDNARAEAFKNAVWTLAEWLVEEYQRAQQSRTAPRTMNAAASENTSRRKLLNVKELSKYISVPVGSIYSDVCMKKIPANAIVRLGRALRFDIEAIDQWVEESRNKK